MANVAYYGGRASALPTSMVQTGQPARSEIVVNQASRARALYEMVAGGPVSASGTVPCAPLPPHGGIPGHDHSGGIFGTPITRPFATWSFGYEDATLLTTITNGRAPQATITGSTLNGVRAYLYRDAFKHVWIPGCAPDGAHLSGRFRVVMYASAAVTVSFTYGDGPAAYTNGAVYQASLAIGRNVFEMTPNCQLSPGVFNRIPFECWLEGSGSGGLIAAALRSVTLNQVSSSP